MCKIKRQNLEEAYRIQQENKELDILVLEQKSKGKGPGVLEAINSSSYELITILDSDISVDPETLSDFFKIVESGRADFVNGTRFVYDMEKNAMKKLNHFGNIFFQFVISLVINIRLTDSLCGTKVFRRSSIENLIGWRKKLKLKTLSVILILYFLLPILVIKFWNILFIIKLEFTEYTNFKIL